MNKKIFNNLKLVVIGIVIALGASYAHAAWTNPESNPPFDNMNIPVNTGTADQIKTGSLSVDTFNAASGAQFNQQVFVGGVIQGDVTPISTVSFGGTDRVDVTVSGGIRAHSYLRSGDLANTPQGNVCADPAGNLVLCP